MADKKSVGRVANLCVDKIVRTDDVAHKHCSLAKIISWHTCKYVEEELVGEGAYISRPSSFASIPLVKAQDKSS